MKRALILTLIALAAPTSVGAAPLEVTGWIPYWRAEAGIADLMPHLGQLTTVSPFGYIVQEDGSLHDAFGLSGTSTAPLTLALRSSAKFHKVKMMPTVMWSDTEAIHRILSNTRTRIALEDEIAALAKQEGFDGIVIDFESKRAETRPYFATFLKGLYQRMGKKWVYCAIEARTPVTSRYEGTPPPDATEYANDYAAINKYCDRVLLMTYDQQRVDVKLNAAAAPEAYIPVADPEWVEKVVRHAAETIAKKKLVIGVATYGYEWHAQPLSQSGYRYLKQWAFNPRYATDLAREKGLVPARNRAGELSFSFVPEGDIDPGSFNILWWSDAQAIRDKVALAETLGVRGVAVFKIDGGEDQGLWDVLPKK